MLIDKITNYIRGEVYFSIPQNCTKDFFNFCIDKDISLKSSVSFDGFTRISVSLKEYNKIAKEDNFEIKVINKKGIALALNLCKKRAGFFIGIICFIITLIVLSQFVWKIEIKGNNRLSNNVVLDALKNFDFYEGKYKKNINFKKIKNEMLLEFCDLSDIIINLDGSIAYVELIERDMPPTKDDTEKPSNLIADCDGKIVKMEITQGKPIAKVGSGVKKGDILVAGFYNGKMDNIVLEHSQGKVTAEVLTSKTFKTNYNFQKKTGEAKTTYYSISILNKEFDFSFGKKKDLSALKKEEKKSQLNVLGLKLPIYIKKQTFIKEHFENITLNAEQSKEIIKKEIEHFEKSSLYDCKILDKYLMWNTESKKGISANVNYKILKNIAKQQIIYNNSSKK